MILAPPPDLIVSYLNASDEYATGDTMRVQFNVSNVGAGAPFETYWQDILVSLLNLTKTVFMISIHHYPSLQLLFILGLYN